MAGDAAPEREGRPCTSKARASIPVLLGSCVLWEGGRWKEEGVSACQLKGCEKLQGGLMLMGDSERTSTPRGTSGDRQLTATWEQRKRDANADQVRTQTKYSQRKVKLGHVVCVQRLGVATGGSLNHGGGKACVARGMGRRGRTAERELE